MNEILMDKLEKYISIFSAIVSFLLVVSAILVDEHSKDLYFFLLLMSTMVITITAMISSIKKSINGAYEKRYDNVRESLENDIIEIQKKLANSEEQWKASYHLILSSQGKITGENDNAIRQLSFLKKFGLTEQDFIVDEKLVFYLTSFSGKYESTYEICKEVCKKMSLTLLRGDEIETTGDIFSQIIRYIVRASLIIVNIDGKNPNVFYELGIAHTLGKNIMFISNRNNEPPFDVRQYRTIFYNTKEELKQSLPESINKYIKYSYQNENPANKYLEESLEICKK